MLNEERRRHILSIVHGEGRIRVREISKSLGVSQITIRNDLNSLEMRGLLQRTHGGALPVYSGAPIDQRLIETVNHQAELYRIGNAAAQIVQEGQCVMLDSGVATAAIACSLKRLANLTIITNDVNIASELADTNFEVILTGGILRKKTCCLVGPFVEDMLRQIHADILFINVDCFNVDMGLTTRNLMDARASRAMCKVSTRVIAAGDSTRFNRYTLSRILPASAIHHIVTDINLPKAIGEALATLNIKLTLV